MRSLSLATFLSFACACSSADPSLEGSASNPVDPNESRLDPSVQLSGSGSAGQLLHDFEFEDLQISFYWLGSEEPDSDGTIAIAENFRADYLGALRAEYGHVTSLEIFNAFAPEGMAPDPRLVARHEPEATAYGRTGTSLAVLDVDGQVLREKSIPANCQSTILPNISPGSYTEIQSTDVGVDGLWAHTCTASPKVSGVQLAVTERPEFVRCESLPATRLLTVGLCNDSASSNSVEFFSEIHTPPIALVIPRGTVTPNSIGRVSVQPDPSPQAPARGAAVFGRNSTFNSNNFHRQITGVGVF